MKKAVSVLLVALLVFVMPFCGVCANAEEDAAVPYRLDALGLTVSIPWDIPVFTRDIAADDPLFELFGFSKEDLDAMMESDSVYLDGIAPYGSYEIVVTMTENPMNDLFYLSDMQLSVMASTLVDGYKDSGMDLIQYEVYHHPQAKFLKIYVNLPDGEETVYGLQYYTVYDGKAINFTLRSYDGSIDDACEDLIKEIVDGVVFDKTPKKKPFAETASFTYTDPKTGLSFVVPENWTQGSPSEPETIDAAFNSAEEADVAIMYNSMDMWGRMPAIGKLASSREEMDNAVFSAEDVAEALEAPADAIQTVTLGGKEYFKLSRREETTYEGITIAIPVTHMVRIQDGYMYHFEFGGEEDSEQYRDFEALVSSAEYVSPPPGQGGEEAGLFIITFIVSLLFTVCVYTGPICIYRFAVIKSPVAPKKARKICIIYAIGAYIVMAGLLTILQAEDTAPGGAIILWSWVNYLILKKGYVEESPAPDPAAPADPPEIGAGTVEGTGTGPSEQPAGGEAAANAPADGGAPVPAEEVEAAARRCPYCGTTAKDGDVFCRECGAKLPDRQTLVF